MARRVSVVSPGDLATSQSISSGVQSKKRDSVASPKDGPRASIVGEQSLNASFGGGRSRQRSINTPAFRKRMSLNQQMEESDENEYKALMLDAEVKSKLEHAWCALLGSGKALANRRCDDKHFRNFTLQCGYGTNDRHMSTALRCYDAQMSDEEDLDFGAWVKTLFHMGIERFQDRVRDPDYGLAIRTMMADYVNPWYEDFRKKNTFDGSEPDDKLLDIREVDRLLYVYDGVLDRLFNRYRDVDQHGNRDLTLDQVKLLDNFVEVEEMKEFMKDFGYFPRYMSFVEISKACQYGCFGEIVIDPTRQSAGYSSKIDASARRGTLPQKPGVPEDMTGPASPQLNISASGFSAKDPNVAEIVEMNTNCPNPLYVPQLPPEFLHNESLLDKPRFMTCFIRLAQMHYNRPEYVKEIPTAAARVEEMLAQMATTYERMFGHKMDLDCDWNEKGPPELTNASHGAAIHPQEGPMNGGFEVTVTGHNFCDKRGVFVRFGEPFGTESIVVRTHYIGKRKILVMAPAIKPTDTVVSVAFLHGAYKISLSHIAKIRIECSNNKYEYSLTEPEQKLTFVDPMPEYTIDEETSAKLMKLFSSVCAYDDRYNTKYMNRDKWRLLKQIADLTEPDNDPFFLEVAEFHDGAHDMSLNFKTHLRVLARTLYEMMKEKWPEGLLRVAEVKLNSTRAMDAVVRIDKDEFTIARRQLALVERRRAVELDVFMGPVLVGTLRAKPGEITSSCTGSRVLHSRQHPFVTYDHCEINTERTLLAHVSVSQSLIHLMNRLRNDGFDFAPHYPKPQTRRPAGRCWTLHKAGEESTQLGAVWDYPGNYSNCDWQPADQEMFSKCLTMCVYVPEETTDYIQLWLLFSHASDPAALRSSLATRGYSLKTKLYRLP